MHLRIVLVATSLLGLLLVNGCTGVDTESTPQDKSTADAQSTAKNIPALQDTLDAQKAQFAKSAPEKLQRIFAEGLEEIAASQVMETALNVGDTAPDFSLSNAVGDTVRLSELLEDGPVILTWYRGGW